MARWLSTAVVAQKLGVGTTSIKRWAEQGILECRHTPGGHRRFHPEQVRLFIESHSAINARVSKNVEEWLEVFSGRASQHAAYDAILRARAKLNSWCALADELGEVLGAMGELWKAGSLSITAEHEISENLSRVLAQCAATIPGNEERVAVLVTAPDDPHTLGLSLLELCMKEMGYNTRWLGARTPVEELSTICEDETTVLIGISASRESQDKQKLEAFLAELSIAANENDVCVLLGGLGNWPNPAPVGRRLFAFKQLPEALRDVVRLAR